MKKSLVLALLLLVSTGAFCQHTYFTLSSGYTNAKVQDGAPKGTGYRINSLFEINPVDVSWTLGFSLGYLHLTGSTSSRHYIASAIPFYFAPKYLFGNDQVKAYIKGAVGA